MLTGLYRDTDGWVRVHDLSLAITIIPKMRYVASGSLPLFDNLPTKSEYDVANAAQRSVGKQGRSYGRPL
jgi:hypothetical protein